MGSVSIVDVAPVVEEDPRLHDATVWGTRHLFRAGPAIGQYAGPHLGSQRRYTQDADPEEIVVEAEDAANASVQHDSNTDCVSQC